MDWFLPVKQRTLALVGESGTGKSYYAQAVAEKYHADFIIDDGLLIRNNRIIAGKSVKEEKTFLAAVKAALFDEKERRDEVARKLLTEKWRNVLILGTSVKMTRKIAARLQIDMPERIIRIEDVSTPANIEKALRRRRIEGKHVIPVPQAEIRVTYPSIFYDGLPVLRKRAAALLPAFVPKAHEGSLVRPEYSKRGKITISKWALEQMVRRSVTEYNRSILVKKVEVKDEAEYRLVITVDIPFGSQLTGKLDNLRDHIIEDTERFTGLLIEEVNIIVDKISEI